MRTATYAKIDLSGYGGGITEQQVIRNAARRGITLIHGIPNIDLDNVPYDVAARWRRENSGNTQILIEAAAASDKKNPDGTVSMVSIYQI